MPSLAGFDNFIQSQNAQPTGLGPTPTMAPPPGNLNINQLIDEISPQYGIDPEVTRALVKLESGGNPRAMPIDPVTKKPLSSAKGLMQLIDGTAREMGVQDPFDPEQNLHGGLRYLRQHLDATGEDLDKALRMYNQGPKGPLHMADDYVGKFRKFYGKEFTPSSASAPTPEAVDIGAALKGVLDEGRQVAQSSPSPSMPPLNVAPVVPDTTADVSGNALERGFTQALHGPQPQLGKLPFGVENKGSTVEQTVKDILYGIPEGAASLASMAIGMVPATAAGLSSFGAAGTPETEAFSDTPPPSMQDTLVEGKERFDKVMGATTLAPQTATGKYIMRPFEVAIGIIYNTHDEVVRDLNPGASPEELEKKFKAGHFVLDVLGAAAAAKGVFRGKPGEKTPPIKVEDVEAAKAEVLANPAVAPEVKAQVESVTPDLIQSIQQKAAQSEAKARVEKTGTIPAKTPENQSIVDGLLTEVELREGRGRVTMRKAATIVAEHDGDIALADLKGIKGINPEGSTGKAVKRLIEERDAQKKVAEKDAAGVGEDIPMGDTPPVIEPVKSLSEIPDAKSQAEAAMYGKSEKVLPAGDMPLDSASVASLKGMEPESYGRLSSFFDDNSYEPLNEFVKLIRESELEGEVLERMARITGAPVESLTKGAIKIGHGTTKNLVLSLIEEKRRGLLEKRVEEPVVKTPAPKVDPLQEMATSIDPTLKYDGKMAGIPEAGVPDIHNLTLTLEDGRQPSFSISDEVTPEKISAEVQKVREKFQPKIEEVIEDGQVRTEGREGLLNEKEVISYRGVGENLGLGSEGKGLYVTSDKGMASEFGSVEEVRHKVPKNPLKVDTAEDGFPLNGEYSLGLDSIKSEDSLWLKLNKEVFQELGIKDVNISRDTLDKAVDLLDKKIRDLGYDAVEVSPDIGHNGWTVLLDPNLIIDKRESLPISEFDTTAKAKQEGYIFPDKGRYVSLERAQAKAAELGEDHEVIKVAGKYKVAKFEETSPIVEFADEGAVNRAGLELMSEIPADKVQFESPTVEEGFGLAKVGDKYYRTSPLVDMPERGAKVGKAQREPIVDGVSASDWEALKAFTDEATLKELRAKDTLKELANTAKLEEVKSPETNAALAQAFLEWRDSYVTKCNVAKKMLDTVYHGTSTGYINPKDIVGKHLQPQSLKDIISNVLDELGLEGRARIKARKLIHLDEYFSMSRTPKATYRRGGWDNAGANEMFEKYGGGRPFKTPELYITKDINRAKEYAETAGEARSAALIALKDVFPKAKELYENSLKDIPILLELEYGKSEFTNKEIPIQEGLKVKKAVNLKSGKEYTKRKLITKESLAPFNDNFKTFKSMDDAQEWMEKTGAVGELIPDPLTGKVSFMNTEKLKGLEDMDLWDEGVEQYSGRSESYSDGMLSSDDLYTLNKRNSIELLDGDGKLAERLYANTSGKDAVTTLLNYLDPESLEAKILNRILPSVEDTKFKITDNPDAYGLGNNPKIAGSYLPSNERVGRRGEIVIAGFDNPRVAGKDRGVIIRNTIHELVHASVDKSMARGLSDRKQFLNTKDSTFVGELNTVYKYAKKNLEDTYGLTDIQEFVAEALSNREFQQSLRSLDDPIKGNILSRFVDSIKKLFGMDATDSNAFMRVLDIVDRQLDRPTPGMEMSETGVRDLFSIFNNERGSVDVTSLYSAVDAVNKVVADAKKMGKSIDDYLAHIGADEVAIAAFKAAMARVPQMKQELREKDPTTSAILMPEGKVVAQTVIRNKNKEVKSVGPPITEELATRAMGADRSMQWGTDLMRVDPETGKVRVEHTTNAFEKAMQATEVKINSFRAAGLSEIYSQWREAKSAAEHEKGQIKEWLDGLESQIAPERREAFALAAYGDMKSVKEALGTMGITEIPQLTPKESMVLEQLFDYTRKFRDRANYIRTHTGQKAIPQLKDMSGRENYLPLMRDLNVLRDMGLTEGMTISDSKKLGELSKKFNGMFNPNAKKRNVSDIPIELDPFKALRRHADYGIAEIHISPVASLAKDLANLKLPRPDGVKGKISLVDWNPNLSRMLSRWSDQIVGKDVVATAMANANPFFAWFKDRLSKNLVVATIGGSLRTVLVQPTSYIIGIPTMLDMRSAGYGISKLMSERPFGKSNARQNSSVLAIREADYAFKELSEYIQRGKMSGTMGYLAEKSLAPMKWVDSIMAEAGWNAARYYGEKRLKLQGQELYRFADDVVERTQGLGIKGAVSDIQSSAATKWLTLLQTFAIADFNLIARDVLGIKNPEMNQSKTIIRVAKYTAATILAGQLYKMIGLDNVVPDPIGAYEEAKKEGKGDLKAVGSAAGELLEKVPIIGGSAKYGSSLFGIAGEWADILPEAGEKFSASLDWNKLTPKQKSYNIRLIARAAGLTMGIPMTNQILKSINSHYKGGDPWEVILGVYKEEKKRKGGLRPEIPRPPQPPRPF